MLRRSVIKMFFISLLILTFQYNVITVAYAQSPTPTTNNNGNALIVKIEDMATKDVKSNKEPRDAQEILLIFGEEAKQNGLSNIDLIQIYTDTYNKEKANLPFISKYFSDPITVFGYLLTFILGLLAAFIKDKAPTILNSLEEKISHKVHKSRFFNKRNLRKYKDSLLLKYQEINSIYKFETPTLFSELYIEPSLSNGVIQKDAATIIRSSKSLVILGHPGMGKSLLLRSILLDFASSREEIPEQSQIPVLIEINKIATEPRKSVVDHLAQILATNGFNNPKDFVSVQLEKGNFFLLFDGLDEVSELERKAVVSKIKDFKVDNPLCHLVICCRTAAYHYEFNDIVDDTFEIVELSNDNVRKFLLNWQKFITSDSKRMVQLYKALLDHPKILNIVRNPLLLSMISFLFILS